MASMPSMPADTPLLRVLGDLSRDGFSDQLVAEPGGEVRCTACQVTVPAEELHVDRIVRLEGASDPADMLAVVAATCPRCEARGALVVGYGPEASADDADVLARLEEAHAHRS